MMYYITFETYRMQYFFEILKLSVILRVWLPRSPREPLLPCCFHFPTVFLHRCFKLDHISAVGQFPLLLSNLIQFIREVGLHADGTR